MKLNPSYEFSGVKRRRNIAEALRQHLDEPSETAPVVETANLAMVEETREKIEGVLGAQPDTGITSYKWMSDRYLVEFNNGHFYFKNATAIKSMGNVLFIKPSGELDEIGKFTELIKKFQLSGNKNSVDQHQL